MEQPTSRRFYPERGSLSLHVWSQPREQGATLHDCSPTLGKGTQALAGPVPAAHVTSSKGPSRAGVRAQVKQQTPVPATSVSRRQGCSASRGSKPRGSRFGFIKRRSVSFECERASETHIVEEAPQARGDVGAASLLIPGPGDAAPYSSRFKNIPVQAGSEKIS